MSGFPPLGFSVGGFGEYSTASRIPQPVVPATPGRPLFEAPSGQFRITRLDQCDVLDAIQLDPVDEGHLNGIYDKSLKTLAPFAQSVGMMSFNGKQMGSCSLISPNLAIIACHCIVGGDVRKLQAKFGYVSSAEHQRTFAGTNFQVLQVVEYDPILDYAIVQLQGTPGTEYGHLKIDQTDDAYGEPALLHHPLGKPLKLSIRGIVDSQYVSTLINTYHDSDYGSSGGAYISPSGNFVALHLGSTRNQYNMNLERLALPIQQILQKRPSGILAYCANGLTSDQEIASIAQPTYFVDFFQRVLDFIDHEKFDKSKLANADYLLRPTGEFPAIVIDSHQKKHSPSWPGTYIGGKGDHFNHQTIGLDEVIELAEKFVEAMPLFKTRPKKDTILTKTLWPLDKSKLGNELFKKLKGVDNIVIVDPTFLVKVDTWFIHFYPV